MSSSATLYRYLQSHLILASRCKMLAACCTVFTDNQRLFSKEITLRTLWTMQTSSCLGRDWQSPPVFIPRVPGLHQHRATAASEAYFAPLGMVIALPMLEQGDKLFNNVKRRLCIKVDELIKNRRAKQDRSNKGSYLAWITTLLTSTDRHSEAILVLLLHSGTILLVWRVRPRSTLLI